METITDLKDETVDGLKKIVKMNIDASKGYSDAADSLDDTAIETAFHDASARRSRLAADLQTALAMSDEDVPDGGTALGAFHRSWMNVRSALNGGDTEVILTEAARGESSLVDAYEDVLVDTAGSPLNATLQQQLVEVKSTRDSIESLKSSVS